MKQKGILSIITLIGLYFICQVIADVSATKLILLGNIVMPAGTLIFAITFSLRDMIHKRLGKEWARLTIIMAAIFNLLQAGYLAVMAIIPAPPFYQYSEAWTGIFAIVPAITLGSIIAELVSELVDTEIYHFWATKLKSWPQWTRVLASNTISLPLDSFLFATFAFVLLPPLFGAEASPFLVALQLTAGQIVWKAIVTVVSLPVIYLVKERSEPLSAADVIPVR